MTPSSDDHACQLAAITNRVYKLSLTACSLTSMRAAWLVQHISLSCSGMCDPQWPGAC